MKIVMSDESSRAFGDVEWFCLDLFIISPAAATGGVEVRCIMACLFVSWSGLGYNCLPGPVEKGAGGGELVCDICGKCLQSELDGHPVHLIGENVTYACPAWMGWLLALHVCVWVGRGVMNEWLVWA